MKSTKLRDYYPLEHKLFLEEVETWTPLRELVRDYGNDELIELYNNFIGEFVEFRSKHIQVRSKAVEKYLFLFIRLLPRILSCQHRKRRKKWRRLKFQIVI